MDQRLKHLIHSFAAVVERLVAKLDGRAEQGCVNFCDADFDLEHGAEHTADSHRDAKRHQHHNGGSRERGRADHQEDEGKRRRCEHDEIVAIQLRVGGCDLLAKCLLACRAARAPIVVQDGVIGGHVGVAECVGDRVGEHAANGILEALFRSLIDELRHDHVGILGHLRAERCDHFADEHALDPAGFVRIHLVEQRVERALHLGPKTLALSFEIELVDLRVKHGADDGAPLVGAQDSVAGVFDLSQICTDETARGQPVNSLPTEPDGGQEQNRGRG